MNERDSHMEQVERWARFVRDNPTKWKRVHTEFINAIFDKEKQFRERLLLMPEGKEKLAKLQKMRNERR